MRKQRAHRPPRVPFGRPLCLTPEGESQEPLQLEAVNLSRGGMFVRTEHLLPQGTRVFLALAAAGQLLDFAEGEVVWVRPRGQRGKTGASGLGLRFTHLRPRAQALVEHLVARGGTGEWATTDGVDRTRRPRKGAHLALASAIVCLVASLSFFGWRTLAKARATEPAPAVMANAIEPVMSEPPAPAPTPTAPRPIDPEARVFPGEFQVELPTGGVSALRLQISDSEIVVTPSLRRGATIRKVFKLSQPARLVIDVGGRQPKYSWQLDGAKVVKSVRVGARNHGTRVVVDLPEPLDAKATRVVPPTGGV